jgi:hypothetical protein
VLAALDADLLGDLCDAGGSVQAAMDRETSTYFSAP